MSYDTEGVAGVFYSLEAIIQDAIGRLSTEPCNQTLAMVHVRSIVNRSI